LSDECRAEAERVGVRLVQAGFLDQTALGRAYAAADCLVLPSASETWGLVVNEALATGLPAIVSAAVGCAPDLIRSPRVGRVFPTGDVAALAAAIDDVRADLERAPAEIRDACRAAASTAPFEEATEGLINACRFVARSKRSAGLAPPRDTSRLLVC